MWPEFEPLFGIVVVHECLDMVGLGGGQAWGVDDIGKLILHWPMCWFGQGGHNLVVIQGGLCLLHQPWDLFGQGGGQVWGVHMAGLQLWWGYWFSKRLGQFCPVAGRWGGSCLTYTGARESETTSATREWSRGSVHGSMEGSGAWPRTNLQGPSGSAGVAVDSGFSSRCYPFNVRWAVEVTQGVDSVGFC